MEQHPKQAWFLKLRELRGRSGGESSEVQEHGESLFRRCLTTASWQISSDNSYLLRPQCLNHNIML